MADDRDLYSGLIRLHVLHHAVEGPVFGLGMIEELSRHGYRISPGSLYPLLQGLEKKGYLRSTKQRERQITPASVPRNSARSESFGRRKAQDSRVVLGSRRRAISADRSEKLFENVRAVEGGAMTPPL
jgi:DNA-binding PadR family transcriptional regulator